MQQGINRTQWCNILILVIVILLLSNGVFYYIRHSSFLPNTAVRLYQKYADELQQVSEYLMNCSEDSVHLLYNGSDTLFQEQYSSLPVTSVAVNNPVIVQSCEMLKQVGVQVIYKEKTNIYFQFFSNLDDGSGILFVAPQTTPPILDSSGISIETIKIDSNFYYYRTILHK